jgi:predicted nucleotidyltransferase
VSAFPDFNEQGDLPVAIHQATLQEVINYFGIVTFQRQRLPRRLVCIFNFAQQSGHIYKFVIFGSFVTTKPEPNDIDIFILMENSFAVDNLPEELKVIFNHEQAQNYEGASIFWIRRLAALDGEDATLAHRQIKRDGSKRGIVEVIHDS